MSKTNWVKQVTRENTLLDRSTRTIAYYQSVREIGKASFARCPVVGFGRISSFYYDPVDYKKQQGYIAREFSGKMGKVISDFLAQGVLWTKAQEKRKLGRSPLVVYVSL